MWTLLPSTSVRSSRPPRKYGSAGSRKSLPDGEVVILEHFGIRQPGHPGGECVDDAVPIGSGQRRRTLDENGRVITSVRPA
jgi:hypothetical protein